MTADEIKTHLRKALDGIEIAENAERELLIAWAAAMRSAGMWGLPGREVLVGVHNKCVLECGDVDPSWNKADFIAD